MKSLIVVLKSILLLSLFGCATGNRYIKKEFYVQPDNFSRIEIRLNDKPGIGFINLGYKDYKYKATNPYLIILKIELNPENSFENGLPNDSELEIATSVLKEIEEKTPIFIASHFVGYVFYDHFLYAYLYYRYPDTAWRFSDKLEKEQDFSRKVYHTTNYEPDWNSVNPFGL